MKIEKKRLIYILSGLLLFQLILIIIMNLFSSQNIKARSSAKKLFKNFNKENVISIEISDYKDNFLIEKKDESWFVNIKNKYIPGDKEKIENYLDLLTDLNQGVVRNKGTNKESESMYGLSEDKRQKVVINMKNNMHNTLYLGGAGTLPGTSYIKINNEIAIREVSSIISEETSNNYTLWSKRMIFDGIDILDIAKCEISSQMDWFRGNYTLEYKAPENNKENENKTKENFKLNPPLPNVKIKEFVLTNIIINIIKMMIDDYKLEGNISEFDIEKASVKLSLKNGKTYLMKIYKPFNIDTGDYIIDVDFNNYVYLVSETTLRKFIKTNQELIEKEEQIPENSQEQ